MSPFLVFLREPHFSSHCGLRPRNSIKIFTYSYSCLFVCFVFVFHHPLELEGGGNSFGGGGLWTVHLSMLISVNKKHL